MARPRLILASQSARRRHLLEHWGFRFEQVDPPYKDPPDPQGADAAELAVFLAENKARSLFSINNLSHDNGVVIIGADTIVVDRDGRLLGKPQTADEAASMIDGMSAADHHVVTGVCLLEAAATHAATFADKAMVRIGNMPPDVRNSYLASMAWQGKAGGYDLWDVADRWPVTVEGDATTVVGLPMRRLTEALRAWDITPTHATPPLPWDDNATAGRQA